MKKISFLFLIFSLVTAQALMAQNRKTNLQLTLTSPTNNMIVPYGQSFNVSITIKNNGPDSVRATDTMVLVHAGAPNTPVVFRINSMTGGANGLASGASASANVAQLQNTNTTGTDQTTSFCAVLLDINSSNLQLTGGGTLHATWDDLDTANNRSCATVTLKTQPATGILDVKNSYEQLVMGPNPASHEVTFTLDLDDAGAVSASVKDIQGREILKKDYGKVASGKKVPLHLDISGLKTGLYFVELNSNNRKSVGKLVVQH